MQQQHSCIEFAELQVIFFVFILHKNLGVESIAMWRPRCIYSIQLIKSIKWDWSALTRSSSGSSNIAPSPSLQYSRAHSHTYSNIHLCETPGIIVNNSIFCALITLSWLFKPSLPPSSFLRLETIKNDDDDDYDERSRIPVHILWFWLQIIIFNFFVGICFHAVRMQKCSKNSTLSDDDSNNVVQWASNIIRK